MEMKNKQYLTIEEGNYPLLLLNNSIFMKRLFLNIIVLLKIIMLIIFILGFQHCSVNIPELNTKTDTKIMIQNFLKNTIPKEFGNNLSPNKEIQVIFKSNVRNINEDYFYLFIKNKYRNLTFFINKLKNHEKLENIFLENINDQIDCDKTILFIYINKEVKDIKGKKCYEGFISIYDKYKNTIIYKMENKIEKKHKTNKVCFIVASFFAILIALHISSGGTDLWPMR